MPSFFSERTAEYSLIPEVMKVLGERFPFVAPIYFWKSREGNSISRVQNIHKRVRIMAMFARRPKIEKLENYVSGRINSSVLNYARHAKEYGVATIAGFIAVDSFFDISSKNRFVWFDLCNVAESTSDYDFLCKLNPCEVVRGAGDFREVRVINIEILTAIINKDCQSMEWDSGMEIIYKLNQLTSPSNNSFFGRLWGGGYKPVLFLVFD
ncbi:hypothetical protein AAHA48_03005 [Dickeya oryzae]|uniref:hypothetical protein n=1 Tax=Dickeya oryzae TaxID=1240404 RepID=UPI003165325C